MRSDFAPAAGPKPELITALRAVAALRAAALRAVVALRAGAAFRAVFFMFFLVFFRFFRFFSIFGSKIDQNRASERLLYLYMNVNNFFLADIYA